MRIASTLVFTVSILVSGAVFAQYDGPGASPATTVKAAHTARHVTTVVLTGNLVEQVGREEYTLRDSTGDIWVKIARHLWDGRHITPETTIRITGSIQPDRTTSRVDVEKVEVVGATDGS